MPQQTVALDFRTLADLHDGRIAVLLRNNLARISQDCMDRPGDPAKRKVTLEFVCEPVADDDGNVDHVKMKITCKAKVPEFKSRNYEMRVSKAGFLFNQDFPEAIDAQSLPFGEEPQ